MKETVSVTVKVMVTTTASMFTKIIKTKTTNTIIFKIIIMIVMLIVHRVR